MKNTEDRVKPLRWYSEEPIFYVYLHKRPTDGSVFYIGKGKDDRAWVSKRRNQHWKNVVAKNGGFDVEIVKDGMIEQDAFKLEAELILSIGIDNLTNQTLGGMSTTGYRHTEDTKKKQSDLMLEKMQDPVVAGRLLDQLKKLHDLQRNDENYKKRMSEIQKEIYANLPDEEKARLVLLKRNWVNNPEAAAKAAKSRAEYLNKPETKENLSARAKQRWDALTEEEYLAKCKIHGDIFNRPENRAKVKEKLSKKIVVNRKFIFSCIRDFAKYVGAGVVHFSSSFKSSEKLGFDFIVSRGYFIEYYNQEIHKDCTLFNNQDIQKLNFDCLPRSKAVATEDRIFLSMKEAAAFTGLDTDARADFITKNLKLRKPAVGYHWRYATNEEVRDEILRRLAGE